MQNDEVIGLIQLLLIHEHVNGLVKVDMLNHEINVLKNLVQQTVKGQLLHELELKKVLQKVIVIGHIQVQLIHEHVRGLVKVDIQKVVILV